MLRVFCERRNSNTCLVRDRCIKPAPRTARSRYFTILLLPPLVDIYKVIYSFASIAKSPVADSYKKWPKIGMISSKLIMVTA